MVHIIVLVIGATVFLGLLGVCFYCALDPALNGDAVHNVHEDMEPWRFPK